VKGKNPIYLLATTEDAKTKWMNQIQTVAGSSKDNLLFVDALEGIVDAAVVTDEKGIIVGLNSKACEILGFTKVSNIVFMIHGTLERGNRSRY
jgi:PAS domain-containing protein